MTMTNAAETDLLELIFTNLDWPNIGDAAGLQNSATVGDIFVSLHTADPGETGDQSTSEATYGAYARQSVVRSAAGWTVSGNNVSNAAEVAFPEATSGSETITHFGLGSALTTGGNLYMSAVLDTSRLVNTGITPRFPIGELDVDAD